MQPETLYTKSGDVSIAYQVFGEGPINLVLSPFFISNVEHFWDDPDMSRWLMRMASFARVAMFDKRGTGMSDRVTEMPGLDQRIDDLRAVMDAAGMEKAAVMGLSEGGFFSCAFCCNLSEPMFCAHSLRGICAIFLVVPDRRGFCPVSRLCWPSLGQRHCHAILHTVSCQRSGIPTLVWAPRAARCNASIRHSIHANE
jgi:pimeloyl-ACP methyl ester carboxylesterase